MIFIESCSDYDNTQSTATASVCTKCKFYFGRALKSVTSSSTTTTTCERVALGCTTLNSSGACTACANERYHDVMYDYGLDASSNCVSNSGNGRVPNCKSYNGSGGCTACHQNTVPTGTSPNISACTRTEIVGCAKLQSDSFLCAACSPGYTISADKMTCAP